ncbi:MAG: hypothetical protein ACRCSK_02140 [Fusobacteriaceae bacterium]
MKKLFGVFGLLLFTLSIVSFSEEQVSIDEATYKIARAKYEGVKGKSFGQYVRYYAIEHYDDEIYFYNWATLTAGKLEFGFISEKKWTYYSNPKTISSPPTEEGYLPPSKTMNYKSEYANFKLWIQDTDISSGNFLYQPKLFYIPGSDSDAFRYDNIMSYNITSTIKLSTGLSMTYKKSEKFNIYWDSANKRYDADPLDYIAIGYDNNNLLKIEFGNGFYAKYNLWTERAVDAAKNRMVEHGLELSTKSFVLGNFNTKLSYITKFNKYDINYKGETKGGNGVNPETFSTGSNIDAFGYNQVSLISSYKLWEGSFPMLTIAYSLQTSNVDATSATKAGTKPGQVTQDDTYLYAELYWDIPLTASTNLNLDIWAAHGKVKPASNAPSGTKDKNSADYYLTVGYTYNF